MPITTVIIISLLLANLALTLIMFWIVYDLISAVKSLQDMEKLSKHAFDLCNDQITNHSNAMKKLFANENAICDSIKAGYDAVCDAYKLMRGEYDSIVDINKKLLECWKGCEERYSQSYELFKHCSDNLKEVSYQLTDLANVSTEDEYTLTLNEACDTVCLDCPYKKCQTEVCPVYEIKHREWTDEDYLEAVNTHPEGDDNIEKD